MAGKLVAVPRPGNLELAKQLTQAENWMHVDELRMAPDLSRAEAAAMIWTISPESAQRC
jgi:hypothetical protein